MGKPVQHNPYASKFSPKVTTLLVASAGPLSNFLAAFVLALPIKFGWVPYINPLSDIPAVIFRREVQDFGDYVGLFLTGAVYLNVILGVFNLLPLPPLDGYNVALGILPDDMSNAFQRLEPIRARAAVPGALRHPAAHELQPAGGHHGAARDQAGGVLRRASAGMYSLARAAPGAPSSSGRCALTSMTPTAAKPTPSSTTDSAACSRR